MKDVDKDDTAISAITDVRYYMLPYNYTIPVIADTTENSCDHEFINVGFQFAKYVYKKCDKEKKE